MGLASLYPSYDSRNARTVSSPRRRGSITTGKCCGASKQLQRSTLQRPVVMGPGSGYAKGLRRGAQARDDVGRGSDLNFNQRKDVSLHSRGALRPRFALASALSLNRGRRESRVPVAPVGPVQQKARG